MTDVKPPFPKLMLSFNHREITGLIEEGLKAKGHWPSNAIRNHSSRTSPSCFFEVDHLEPIDGRPPQTVLTVRIPIKEIP